MLKHCHNVVDHLESKEEIIALEAKIPVHCGKNWQNYMVSHQETFRYSRFLFYVALIQGIYYLITGIWPLLHMPSFIFITGPKYDVWLVRTVGVLILVQGLVCISAAVYKRIGKEIVMLAVGAAAGLAVIDIYYASIDRIWNVYLLDALAEVVLIVLWLIAWTKSAGRE